MSVKFEFYLSDSDVDRLFAIKEDRGKNDLTGNEFAKELIEKQLHTMHPERVRFDEETGERIKASKDVLNIQKRTRGGR